MNGDVDGVAEERGLDAPDEYPLSTEGREVGSGGLVALRPQADDLVLDIGGDGLQRFDDDCSLPACQRAAPGPNPEP